MWRYLGKGAFYPGIPARNLTDEEADEFGAAGLALYEKVDDEEQGAAPTRRSRSSRED